LHAINPKLIVCSISGFGHTGPWRDLPGYDFVVQALSGLMSITGEPEGDPMKVGVALTDVLTGLFAAISVLAALHGAGGWGENRRSLESSSDPSASRCQLDLSLLDCTLASLVNVAQAFLVTNQRPERYGNAHPHIVPYECFVTSGGHLVLAIGNDEQWTRFCHAAQQPELALDSRFQTNPLRVRNRSELVATLRPLLASRSSADWSERLSAAQVPHAPVLALDQVFALPQVQERQMVIATPGGLKMVASPIHCTGHPSDPPTAPPRLGEHSEEVLRELGYSIEQIRRLGALGVVST
jgi:crotonobetainyl-CoA:carnitine CoA-transferase CaiB-like acyl-CoA transferase